MIFDFSLITHIRRCMPYHVTCSLRMSRHRRRTYGRRKKEVKGYSELWSNRTVTVHLKCRRIGLRYPRLDGPQCNRTNIIRRHKNLISHNAREICSCEFCATLDVSYCCFWAIEGRGYLIQQSRFILSFMRQKDSSVGQLSAGGRSSGKLWSRRRGLPSQSPSPMLSPALCRCCSHRTTTNSTTRKHSRSLRWLRWTASHCHTLPMRRPPSWMTRHRSHPRSRALRGETASPPPARLMPSPLCSPSWEEAAIASYCTYKANPRSSGAFPMS